MTDHKPKILDALEKLKQIEIVNNEPFKIKAYSTVIKNLQNFDKPIHTFDDIKDIKGIGKSIGEKIKELIDTGKLSHLKEYEDSTKTINELTNIHGIGPVKAKELVETHHIKNIEDLKNHTELLNDIQKLGLKYYEHFIKRIPRKEMEKHDEFLKEVITKIDPNIKFQVVGSYRRGLKDSGDIDVIITDENQNIIPKIIEQLKKEKYITDDFALGPHKYLGVCKLKRHHSFRRIDLLYSTKEVWPFSILYFTGSAEFNVKMRNWALSKGLSLSEYGLKKNKTLIKHDFETEADIFEYLGLQYMTPTQRTSKAEVIPK